MRKLWPCIMILAFAVNGASAQTKEEKDKQGTFFKVGAGHSRGSVYDFPYSFNYLTAEIETHFSKKHLKILSGFTIGYRKEDVRFTDFGHFFNFRVFGKSEGKAGFVKCGGGMEWGLSGNRFDRTVFNYRDGELISYDHVYLKGNFFISRNVYRSSVHYPVLEISAGKKTKRIIIETGIRTNFPNFGLEKYDLENQTFESKRRIRAIPSVFVSIGINP